MTTDLLILGSGPCAAQLAHQMAGQGASVVIARGDDQQTGSGDPAALPGAETKIKVIDNAHIIEVRGGPGSYRVDLKVKQELISIQSDRIALADAPTVTPAFASYGLAPSEAVMALSDLERLLSQKNDAATVPLDGVKRAVFINSLAQEGHPWLLERVMRSALALQTELGIQAYLMTGNLKVAGDGLEAMYRQCKQAGIIVFKFAAKMPQVAQDESGRASFQFADDVTGHLFQLTPDLTIVDENCLPSALVAAAAGTMRLIPDSDGFAQTDNVHRLTTLTNRRGIYALGPARTAWGSAQIDVESACAAMAAACPLPAAEMAGAAVAQIDKGRCIRCLTCLRVCHYGAIALDPRPEVVPDLCERCGACAAECPRKAVTVEDLSPKQLLSPLFDAPPSAAQEPFEPAVVAFCCDRSALQARDLAHSMGKALPPNLKIVAVPCGGGIGADHILECLRTAADGVILFTCHDGNCHSERGSDRARQRVGSLSAFLPAAGLEQERVRAVTIASNMGNAFAEEVNRFAQAIGQLGPNPLIVSAG